MADNVEITAGADATPPAGTVVAADDINGVAYQRIKIVLGADGETDGDVNDQNPVPVYSVAMPISENCWHDERFDYTSGDLDYAGKNITHKVATDSNTWFVWKYTWSGLNCTRIEGPLVGSWDGRAALDWA